jgi:mRNA interferase MazF
MKRGEIWTVAGAGDYAGKPRPVVIVQDESFDATDSVTVCPLTTISNELPLFRIPVRPDEHNGLRLPSHLMADKISSVARTKLGRRMGTLGPGEMAALSRALILFLRLIQTK